MKNKIIPIILIFVMSLSSSVFASDTNIVSWTDMVDFFNENINEDITTYENIDSLKNEFNSSNKFWFFDDSQPCRFLLNANSTNGSAYDFNKTSFSTNYFYIAFNEASFTYSKDYTVNCDAYVLSGFGGFLIDIDNNKVVATSSYSRFYYPVDYYTDFSASLFATQSTFEYIVDHITLEANNYTISTTKTGYSNIVFDEIDASDYPWNNVESDSSTSAPSYDYTDTDYWENHNLPYFSYSHLDGYVSAGETKPDYLESLSYTGTYYFNLPFYIYNDPLSTYDFTHDTIRLGVYSVSNESGENKYTLLDYFDASAGAVYITGEQNTGLYNGYDRYLYDLFAIYNYDGKLDKYVEQYTKNGLAFKLYLYTPLNELVAYTSAITLSGNLVSDSNNPTQDIVFDENAGFFELLESSKSFISRFLSFFDIFPSWLTSLLATAITVAIICRLIGR